ncbi:hypothetical protein F5Y11DRAFT_344599 [Daldinia sp. FL1419]|nr:hypothetical protein F5Y11DRAFT_344599 [Daldinia sp. FL1419]
MSATIQAPGKMFQVPEISQDEMGSFHDAHFSFAAIELFGAQFLRPENAQDDNQYYEEEYEEYDEEEEEDGLGYYADGVKRTLTDEQIAIFRHSEIEALRRAKARAAKIGDEPIVPLEVVDGDGSTLTREPNPSATTVLPPTLSDKGQEPKGKEVEGQDGSEDGEIEEERPEPTEAEIKRKKKQRAKRKKHEQRKFHPEKKPDLRKRTWDVVETGMDSLYYDDETAQDTTATPAAQRRRISYDD